MMSSASVVSQSKQCVDWVSFSLTRIIEAVAGARVSVLGSFDQGPNVLFELHCHGVWLMDLLVNAMKMNYGRPDCQI